MTRPQIRTCRNPLRRIARLLEGRARLAIFMMAISVIGVPLVVTQVHGAPVRMDTNVLVILDSSGSMWGKVSGQPKMASARKILDNILGDLPSDARLGLLTYGHQRKDDCSDIELLSPIGSENAAAILKKVKSLQPKGTTPLAEALLRAKGAFKGINGAKMIVLITDGGEECHGDPCAVAKKLALSGLVVRVDILGFDISKRERDQLECVAKEGTGRYFNVKDKASLYAAMGEVKKDIMETGAVKETALPAKPVTVAPVPVPPAPPVSPKPDGVNLLLSSEGGQVVVADNLRWQNAVSGSENASMWTWPDQEVVFAFKDEKPARFSKFAIRIPGTLSQNVKAFELLAGDDSPTGTFRSLGQFTTQNILLAKSPYQEFTFPEITAKYFKFKIISNYGYPMHGWGNTQIFQMRLMGSLM